MRYTGSWALEAMRVPRRVSGVDLQCGVADERESVFLVLPFAANLYTGLRPNAPTRSHPRLPAPRHPPHPPSPSCECPQPSVSTSIKVNWRKYFHVFVRLKGYGWKTTKKGVQGRRGGAGRSQCPYARSSWVGLQHRKLKSFVHTSFHLHDPSSVLEPTYLPHRPNTTPHAIASLVYINTVEPSRSMRAECGGVMRPRGLAPLPPRPLASPSPTCPLP